MSYLNEYGASNKGFVRRLDIESDALFVKCKAREAESDL